MSAHENREFEQRLAAHANRELSAAAASELRAWACGDDGRTAEVEGVDALHGLFDAERQLYREAVAPLEPREEADPVLDRLRRRAARVEQELRARPAAPVGAGVAPGRGGPPRRGLMRHFPMRRFHTWKSPVWLGAAAAVVVAAVVFTLSRGAPADETLGPGGPGAQAPSLNILLTQHVSAESRDISWHAVPGARSYDVVITDEANETVLARPDDQARSTTWELTLAEIEQLRQQTGPLYLRISAFDGGGFDAGSTGDRVLRVK